MAQSVEEANVESLHNEAKEVKMGEKRLYQT